MNPEQHCGTPAFTSSVYGPVPSWRFGSSLGIDLIVRTSTCSFNCIYCQLGNIQQHISEQAIYVPTEKVIADLKGVDWSKVDVVTVSGSGEPTLALNLGEVIAHIKDTYRKPVMVLTNSTMLEDPATQQRLWRADTVACKLDAADDDMLRRINRPVEGVTLEGIVRGIEAFRDGGFPGRLALQCMLMPANLKEVPRLIALIRRIGPHEIHLNTPRRPYPKAWYQEARGNHVGAGPVEEVRLKTITLEDARAVERQLREAFPETKILSVYQEAPEA